MSPVSGKISVTFFGALFGVVVLLTGGPVQAQRSGCAQGATCTPTAVIVDSPDHWKNWTFPSHLTRMEDGAVRPREFRGVFDVLEDTSFLRTVSVESKAPRVLNLDSTVVRFPNGETAFGTACGGDSKADPPMPCHEYFLTPGATRAGSNAHLAEKIVDDNLATFWEPDPDDDIDDWWVEVDLARPVAIDRVKLTFVDSSLGDPFYRFFLMTTHIQDPLFESSFSYTSFQPFEGANTDRREILFVSEPRVDPFSGEEPAPDTDLLAQGQGGGPSWTGRLAELLRIAITGSRFGRAELISADAWQGLRPGERGDIIYHMRDVNGKEEPIELAHADSNRIFWERLGREAPQRQGHRDFYRRELPRLAEVEVWGLGDSFASEMLEGGGSVMFLNSQNANANVSPHGHVSNAFDGSYQLWSNYWHQWFGESSDVRLFIDIGGAVWLNQLRTMTSWVDCPQCLIPEPLHFRGYRFRGSAGVRDAQGNLVWERLTSLDKELGTISGTTETLLPRQSRVGGQIRGGSFPPLTADDVEPAKKVRFVDMTAFLNMPGQSDFRQIVRIFEIQLLAEGPAAEVVLESDLIEIAGKNLGAVTWEADTEPGLSEVEIRTRTGDQLVEEMTYFNTSAFEWDEATYNKARNKNNRGPIIITKKAGPSWSPWSQKYRAQGGQVSSPAPRQFLQIQARLQSLDGQSVPELRRIAIELTTPAARSLTAEIWPAVAAAGRVDTFEVLVQPTFVEEPVRSLGFDELRLSADPALELSLVDVALGTRQELATEQPFQLFDRRGSFTADGDPVHFLTSAAGDTVQILSDFVSDRGDSLWLGLPETVTSVAAEVAPLIYYRNVSDEQEDEVPTNLSGELLSEVAWLFLEPQQQGSVKYFTADFEEVDDEAEYESLDEADRGPVRYFRKVIGRGEQSIFSADGDTLTRPAGGDVVGQGRLLRVRFTAAVFLPATQLNVSVRNAASQTPWQAAEPGNATDLRPGDGLSVGVVGDQEAIDDISIAPNPFTPNGDTVNDEAVIEFSLFAVFEARPTAIRMYTLSGHPVRTLERPASGGRQTFRWNGRDDDDRLVPPGLYLCQIEVDTDSEALEGTTRTHVIAVAY